MTCKNDEIIRLITSDTVKQTDYSLSQLFKQRDEYHSSGMILQAMDLFGQ